MANLYEIAGEYQRFIDLVENGEIPEEAIADTLEGLEGELEAKIDNIACVIKNMTSLCEDIKYECERLIERKKAKEREIKRLKSYIQSALERLGKSKFESARNKILFRKSNAVVISDEDKLLKWLKENAPEAVNVKTSEEVSLSVVKELLREKSIPFAIIETRKNMQLS